LTAAAVSLVYEQGVERTTLADIADRADVPVGNVYYYFKTKDDILAAVIDAHAQQVQETLAAIDARHRTPKSRLKAFVQEVTRRRESVAELGCPMGTLCSELDKRAHASQLPFGDLLRLPIAWAEEQFRALGRREARDLAFELLATYEGSALLANTMRDPEILAKAGRRLDRWIDAL
jgi:AcrR family transcriptional regulator